VVNIRMLSNANKKFVTSLLASGCIFLCDVFHFVNAARDDVPCLLKVRMCNSLYHSGTCCQCILTLLQKLNTIKNLFLS